MKAFVAALLRLKQQAGVSTDKEVAALLDMKETALNARKARDAFPEDKVWALAQRRPDLVIDPGYVITGRSSELQRAANQVIAAELALATATQQGKPGTPAQRLKKAAAIVEALHTPLSADEQLLLDAYRDLSPAGRKAMLAIAVSGDVAVKAANHQRNTGAGSIQVGTTTGNVSVKNGGINKRRR